MNRRHDDERPILITQAAPSYDEEFAARKKRYSIIMACRVPCLVLAGVLAIAFNLTLVPVLLIVLSVPLPWVAVLIANDRLPQKAGKVNKYEGRAQRLAAEDRKVLEASEVLDARDTRADARGHGSPEARIVDVPDPDAPADQSRDHSHDEPRDDPPRRTG